jgi:hypothetical protein
MAYDPITSAEIASGKPVCGPVGFGKKVKDNLDYLYGAIGSSAAIGVLNGSFEIDSDADGVPDSWTRNLYAGGTSAIYTAAPASGANAFSFIHPGGASNGGGNLTSDYIECSPLLNYILSAILWSTAAGMKNKIQVQFYDKTKTANGSAVDLYNSVANPTSATAFLFGIKPTASSAFFKIILIGGFTDTDVAGTTYFDDVQLRGVFPDVTAGVVIIASGPTARSGAEGVYTKYKEAKVLRAGTYRVIFTLVSSTGDSAYGRIYKNGVGFGTERSTDTTPVTFSEDLVFSVNDLIQIYCHNSAAATYTLSAFTVGIAANNNNVTQITD